MTEYADARLLLHEKLESLSKNVYFIQGDGTTLQYPCFVYSYTRPDVKRANSKVYDMSMGFNVTYMTKNHVTVIDKMLDLFDYCSVDTLFVSDGVRHENFTVYIRRTI